MEGVNRVIAKTRRIDETFLEELEEVLILSDMGVDTAGQIIDHLRQKSQSEAAKDQEEIIRLLKAELIALLNTSQVGSGASPITKPHVISIVGVNGTGKTTTIGKLAFRYRNSGQKVLVAAADTFRAAAGDQLSIWAHRAGVDIVQNQPGADPASVAFDALKAASSRDIDVMIIDTAGRLHTKSNLMAELSKIHRVLAKLSPEAPHEVLLVMDATTGQNGLTQARKFLETVNVSGMVLTKLDGTAKGGIVFAIVKELGIPVRYVGVGEQIDDLAEFDAETFVEALFQ